MHLTSRCARVSIKFHQSNCFVVGASGDEVAVVVPGYAVDGALVMLHALDNDVYRLHFIIVSVMTQLQSIHRTTLIIYCSPTFQALRHDQFTSMLRLVLEQLSNFCQMPIPV